MEKTPKFLFFDRKEIAVIFLCMILLAVISFILGLQIGRLTNKDAGFTLKDVKEDAKVVDTVETRAIVPTAAAAPAPVPEDLAVSTEVAEPQEKPQVKVKAKARTETVVVEAAPAQKEVVVVPEEEKIDETTKAEVATTITEYKAGADLKGKFTIQLGSYRTAQEAEKFADGFRVRGYEPFINEVMLQGKGTWYRVSMGTFDAIPVAKAYVTKEASLFSGQDYVIGKIE